MKTLLVTAFLAAFAVAACSSDTTPPLVTNAVGTAQQGAACTSSSDCEAPLECGFPTHPDGGGVCPTTGQCVAMGPCSIETYCPCSPDAGGPVNACVSPLFSNVAGKPCAGSTGPADAATGG
jgi:hypothetical protein